MLPKGSKRLPRTYYAFMAVWLLVWGIVGVAAAVSFGVNPYVGFLVVSWAALLIEVYKLKRAGY